MSTYELTTCTREEFENVQAQMVSDFAAQAIGAEVYKHNTGYGRITSCFASGHSLESIIITVYFDETDETKNYLLSSVMAISSLVFTDTSLVELYGSFMEEQYKLKAQYNKAVEDDQRRQKEAAKLEKKHQDNEKKMAGMKAQAEKENSQIIAVCAQLEAEIATLDGEEKAMFLEDLGLEESGLEKLIKASYSLLGLISYLTAGEDETRAWTIKKGTKAPQAAGKIHSDFERGFIRAEVVNYQDLLEYGSLSAAKAKGVVGTEGKEYVVKDGDVMLFLFNV